MEASSEVKPVLEKLKTALFKRGYKTVNSLGRLFKIIDSVDGNRKIDASEFRVGLSEIGVTLTKSESDILLSYFDKDGDKTINIDEFLLGIRGELNETRKQAVLQAFNKFDTDGSGAISIVDLSGVYSVEKHPKYISGEKTKDQIFKKFLNSFGDKNEDGVITQKEFLEYYSAVSSSIDDDEYFVKVIKNAWLLE